MKSSGKQTVKKTTKRAPKKGFAFKLPAPRGIMTIRKGL